MFTCANQLLQTPESCGELGRQIGRPPVSALGQPFLIATSMLCLLKIAARQRSVRHVAEKEIVVIALRRGTRVVSRLFPYGRMSFATPACLFSDNHNILPKERTTKRITPPAQWENETIIKNKRFPVHVPATVADEPK